MVSGDVSLSLAKTGGVGPGLADLQVKADLTMTIRIVDDTMTLEIDNRVVAMARFGEHARRQQRCVDRLHSPAGCSPVTRRSRLDANGSDTTAASAGDAGSQTIEAEPARTGLQAAGRPTCRVRT
jgi:hypothetical protein